MAPGGYRLLVQAVNAAGVSGTPAVVAFEVEKPFYLQWWFELAALAVISLSAYGLHTARVRQIVALQKVRSRIALDLHDDIGASLSQIAILSELSLKRLESKHPAAEPLERIAEASREVVDSISDIVWAINPKRDRLADLLHRIRRFANDVLTGLQIGVRFRLPSEAQDDLHLEPDTRREIYLICKEGINNIARHSNCTEVQVEVRVEGGEFLLRLSDNGSGFTGNAPVHGNGLESMQQRARNIGGTLEFTREESPGTTLVLKAPLNGRRRKAGRII